MGFRIEAPKQDGNARFNTLKVNLNENNSATRTVVSDEEGNFYYGAGGGGGTGGTNGTSGTSGANGSSGSSGSSGTSGTSGTGFNTIADPLQGRVLLSDGSTNNASASLNLFYDTGSSVFQVTGSISSTQGFTGSLFGTSSWAISASWAPIQTTVATASYVSSSNVYGPYGFDSIRTSSFALTASSADNFTVRGTLTAQTIVAETITSSTDFVTGSTKFVHLTSNTHQFTGIAKSPTYLIYPYCYF